MIVFLLIYLALVIIRPQDYPALADAGLPLLPVTLMLAFGTWLLQRQPRDFGAPTYALLVAFTLAAMASVAANGWLGGAWEFLGQFLPILIAFTLTEHAAREPRNIGWLLRTLVLCALVLVAHGIEQVQLGVGWTGMGTVDDGRIQYVGVFSDPNDLSMLFVLAMPLALLLGSQGGALGLRRVFWWAAAGLLLYGVYLTDSRGAWLAVLAMIGVWLWRRRGLLVAGLVAVAGLAAMMALPTRLQTLDAGESSAFGRIDAWYEGMQMFLAQPLLGVGANNFVEHNYLTAHNSLVLVLAETGIIGFTVWLAFVSYAFLMTLAVLRVRGQPDDPAAALGWRQERALALTLLVALSGFFACAFFLSRSYMILVYLVVALVTGWYGGARARWPDLPAFRLAREWPYWPMIAVVAVIALWLLVKVLLVLGS